MADTPIAELFDRDPMKLSEQDITRIIQSLREQRGRFVLGEKSAGKPASRAKPKADAGQLDINDILGDIL
jgi:hypothetical protein